MSLLSASEFTALQTAVDWSITQLAKPREQRVSAIKEYVGSHYADNDSEKRVPVDLLELAITIYTRQLAPQAPRVLVTTPYPTLKIAAKEMAQAINQVPAEIGLADTLRAVVMEAMFSLGIVKVGISTVGTALGHDYGQPYVDLVSIDDYFVDMSANSYDKIQFEGNDYWVPFDVFKNSGQFKIDDSVEADEPTVTGDQGEARAEGISTSEGADLYEDKIWLRDVWLPDRNKLITYTVKGKKQVRAIEFDGPEVGPYHRLGFSSVPGNLLPLPPVALWRDMHELSNALFRKLARQAQASKNVMGFAGGNDESAQRFADAKDGEGILYTGGEPKNLVAGGVDQLNLAFFLQTRDLFSYFGGNLDTLGGLAPQADTVGQDQLLSQAAGTRMTDMADQVRKFAKGVFSALAWYEWTDPIRVRMLEKAAPGDIMLTSQWSDETREGDFLDYNFDIDVFSLQDESPSAKLQKLGVIFDRYVIPLLPNIQEQGGRINLSKLFSTIAQYANVPEVSEIVEFDSNIAAEGEMKPEGNAQPERVKAPAHTTRTYERVNRPGATRAGKDDVMSRLLMGGTVQGSEAATLNRRVG